MRRLLALRASPERAFESLYERHARDVYRYAFAVLGDASDAEDVTQATFLNAYRAITRGAQPRSVRAWLHSIALNLCRQRFRHAARRPLEVPLEDDLVDAVSDDETPTLEDLTRALKHLPFNQRAALVMREFEGRSPREIAQALELSLAAVETTLFRARRGLREQLESTLTCQDAERAISLQQDGMLARRDRERLRGHLRACSECARRARRARAQRGAMKSLVMLPLPSSLSWATVSASVATIGAGAGGAPVLGSLAAKLAAGVLAASALIGAGYEGATHIPWLAPPAHHARHAMPHGRIPPPVTVAQNTGARALGGNSPQPASAHSRQAIRRRAPSPVSVAAEPKHDKPANRGLAQSAFKPHHIGRSTPNARNAKPSEAKPPNPRQQPIKGPRAKDHPVRTGRTLNHHRSPKPAPLHEPPRQKHGTR